MGSAPCGVETPTLNSGPHCACAEPGEPREPGSQLRSRPSSASSGKRPRSAVRAHPASAGRKPALSCFLSSNMSSRCEHRPAVRAVSPRRRAADGFPPRAPWQPLPGLRAAALGCAVRRRRRWGRGCFLLSRVPPGVLGVSEIARAALEQCRGHRARVLRARGPAAVPERAPGLSVQPPRDAVTELALHYRRPRKADPGFPGEGTLP